jgi:hypothetical protein
MKQMHRRAALGLSLGAALTALTAMAGLAQAAKPDPLPPAGAPVAPEAAPPAAAPVAPPAAPAPAAPGSRFTFADGGRCEQASITIINDGAQPIQEVYLRLSGTSSWGTDRLGDSVIAPGARRALPAGQITYDLLLVRADGQAFTVMRRTSCGVNGVVVKANGDLEIGMLRV